MSTPEMHAASRALPAAVGGQYLVRLTYVSRSTSKIDGAGFKQILEHAQRQNSRRGITGMLCFNSDLFLQTIEGSRPVINALYSRLVADPRHSDVQLVELVEIPRRNWGQWSMGYAVASSTNREVFLRYSAAEVFEPYSMTAEAIQSLLKELAFSEMRPAVPAP